MQIPWPAGTATGVGSMPGTEAELSFRRVLEALPEFPHLVELPGRGAGAEMIGRTAALLADLHVDLQPPGWRLLPAGAGAGRDERRATDFLRRDLDVLQEVAGEHEGPFKVQTGGPWTTAAALELPRGGPVLADAGATRDVTEALAEGLADHVAEVRRRVPGAQVWVQLDEPSLPIVLAGHVRTPSGFSVLPPVEEPLAQERLTTVLAAATAAGASAGVHCCAAEPPLTLLRDAGARFLSVEATGALDLDAVGEAVEAGCGLLLGIVASTGAEGPVLSDPSRTVEPVRRLWRRLGFQPEQLGEVVAVSPTCGMAGATPEYARAALRAAHAAAALLRDDPA